MFFNFFQIQVSLLLSSDCELVYFLEKLAGEYILLSMVCIKTVTPLPEITTSTSLLAVWYMVPIKGYLKVI